MKTFRVFLSSAMTGELGRERDGIRVLFQSDSTIKEFFSLYAIEEHASPHSIEKAFTTQVGASDVIILLLDKQLRDAVKKEFCTARENGLRIFIYIKNRTDARDEAMKEFISQEAHEYHCGSFSGSVDLCDRVKKNILADLKDNYQQAITTSPETDYQVISENNVRDWSSSRFFDYQTISRVSETEPLKEMTTDQLIVLAHAKQAETGNLKESLLIYEVILHREPNNWQAMNNRGLILDDMGHYEDALFSYRLALSINPESHATLYNIGNYYRNRHQYDQALKYYLAALEIKPDKVSALGHIVSIYLNTNDGSNALKYAEKAYSIEKTEGTIFNLCMALTMCNMRDDALRRCEELSESDSYRKARAYIFFDSNLFEDALSEIEAYLREGRKNYDLTIKKVHCLLNTGQVEDAISCFKTIELTDYVYAFDYNNIGWALYEQKSHLEYSIELFQKAVDSDASLLAAWKNLTCVLGELEKHEEGLDAANCAIQYYPDDIGLIMNRSWFLILNGNLQESIAYMSTECGRLLGNTQSSREIKTIINESVSKHGFKDIESLEKLIRKKLAQSEGQNL